MNTQLGISSTARRKTIYSVIAGSILFLLFIVLIPETLPNSSSAESGVVPTPSLTFSGSHAISLTVNPGQFGTSDTQNLVVETTNYTGYTMSITPSTGNSTDLVNTAVNTYTIPSIASTTTLSSFQALSTAAYGLSTDNGTTYLPITNGGELYSTNGATDSTTGGMTIKLGAKAISSTPSGDYTKAFTLTATANAALYNIIFDANAGEDTVTNMPTGAQLSGADVILPFEPAPTRAGFRFLGWDTNQNATQPTYTSSGATSFPIDPEQDATVNTKTLYAIWGCGQICYHGNGADAGTMSDQTIIDAITTGINGSGLRAPSFSRAGYGFAGWNTEEDGSGTTYGPNQTLTAAQAGNGLDLYAVWVPAEKDGNNNPIYLQGWTGCSSPDLHDGDVIALTDSRDGNVYAVAKIEKNIGETNEYSKCWLIENLRLDIATASITSTNTDHPTDGFRHEAANLSSAFWDTCTNSNSACIDHISYGIGNVNGTDTAAYSGGTQNTPWYSYGGMYGWYAATAGTGTYNKSSSNANGSICPSGWNLPTGGSSGDLNELDIALGGTGASQSTYAATNRWRTYPINSVYSGYYYISGAYDRGTYGQSWSSTAYTDNLNAYGLRFGFSGVYINTNYQKKYVGSAIRCLAGSMENFTITYDANGGDANSVPEPQTSSTQGNGIYTFTLVDPDTEPTRTGYTFAGWIDEEGNEANAGGTYTAYNTATTLYARWTNNSCKPDATTIGTGNSSTDAVCLQDVNATVKSTMSVADSTTGTYTLIDARDNKEYTIAKLDDGEVWMTKNLNYGNSSDITLNSYDTDLPSGYTFRAPASTTDFEATNSNAAYINPKILIDNTYGGYYSYAAAIASTTAYSTASQNITTSICPAGWDLPTSTQYKNLKTVASLTSYAKANAAPYSFSYAGYRDGASFTSQTNSIRLWTSTNYSAANAYYTTSYSVPSYSSNYKRYGESIRCIASNGTGTINYDANNGGSGTMPSQVNVEISLVAISDNLFVPDQAPTGHRRFRNWCTNPDGTGACAKPGDAASKVATEGQTVTLYAQWEDYYTITFTNTEGGATKTKDVIVGQSTTLAPDTDFIRSNYGVAGWDTSSSGTTKVYAYNQAFTPSSDLTLYTVWKTATTLDTGQNVNAKLKKLAGNVDATYYANDTNIKEFRRATTLPADLTVCDSSTDADRVISTTASTGYPVCISFDNANDAGIMYYYTDAEIIYANTNSSRMFNVFLSLSNIPDISNWNTSKVTRMEYMFDATGYNATTFSLNLSGWDTSSVTSMSYMFDSAGYNATTFSLDLSGWNTSKVTGMAGMFSYAGYSATNWSINNLSGWDASQVANMNDMFSNAGYNATTFSPNLSGWDTSGATTMQNLFYNAGYNADTFSLDLSSWDTSKVTNMTSMFQYAGRNATTWSTGNLSSWNTSRVTTMYAMFYYAGVNATTWSIGNISNWDTSEVTSMHQMFESAGYDATTWSIGNLSRWNTSKVKDTNSMFFNAGHSATTWSIGDLSDWDTSNITTMSNMFSGAGYSATTWSIGDLSDWDTSSVTTMGNMFADTGYSAATWSIGDLSNWDTSKVTGMSTMFYEAGYNATDFSLDLSGWDTSKATGLTNMFSYAGHNATTWTVIIPPINGGGINNTTARLYGNTTSKYATPASGKQFTIARNLTLSLGTNVDSVIINGKIYSDGDTARLGEGLTYNISATFSSGYALDSWAVTGTGTTIASTSVNPTTITIGSANATLTVVSKTITSFDDAYAAAGKSKQGNYYTMQDMNANICDAVTTGQTGSLIDTRDNTVYTVAKLTDDQCWMTKNMRLDFSSSVLTSQSVADLESATNNPASGFWAAAQGATASNSGFDSNNYDVVKYSKINIGDDTTDSNDHTYDEYGIYYNWYTATAGHGVQSKSSGNTDGDLCPNGWHLPTGGAGGEFGELNNAVNNGSSSSPSGLLASPAGYLLSGFFIDANANGRGSYASYWSSTADGYGVAYDLYFGGSYVYPGTDSDNEYGGQAVRCLADNTPAESNQQSNEPQNSPQEQSAEPQATPSAMPSVQSMSLSAPANTESTDAEDQTEGMEDSEATSTAPLGVKRSSDDKTNAAETVASVSSGTVDESDAFGLIALVGAGVATTSGLLLLAGKRRKDDEEDEPEA